MRKENIYDYAEAMFKGVCELNNYDFTLLKDGNVLEKKSRKYYYVDTSNREFISVCKSTNKYDVCELANIAVKFLYVLGIDDVSVCTSDKDICEALLSIELDAREGKTSSVVEIYIGEYLVGSIVKDETYRLAICYEKMESYIDINTIEAHTDKLEVSVVPEDEELFSDALIIGTMVRDAGYKCEVCYDKKTGDSSFTVLVNKKEQPSFSVILKDNATSEEKVVSINNLVDELDINY